MEEILHHLECITPGMYKNLVNNGINYLPKLVQDFFHQPYIWLSRLSKLLRLLTRLTSSYCNDPGKSFNIPRRWCLFSKTMIWNDMKMNQQNRGSGSVNTPDCLRSNLAKSSLPFAEPGSLEMFGNDTIWSWCTNSSVPSDIVRPDCKTSDRKR